MHRQTEKIESAAFVSNKLFKRYTAVVAFIFAVGSFTPVDALSDNGYATHMNVISDAGSFEETLLIDNDGYLTKINPQTNFGDRSTMNDRLVHTVAPGETLSTIAEEYGLKTSTLLWENGLSNANSLRTGQKLSVPPVDGITHRIAKGETVEKLAKSYGVTAEAIKKQNSLIASTVTVGQDVYIPGGKPLVDDVRTTPARAGTGSRATTTGGSIVRTPLTDSDDVPVGDKPFIFPTRGKITQSFHAGHYAYDIGNRSQPPIWAAGGGKVVKAVTGCAKVSYGCGGGYGNHVIIDHGNGLQTLYGHMEYLDVSVGDQVTQGQVLGKMGRSGNVRGATGIHLHFEVRKNGVKQVPSKYY